MLQLWIDHWLFLHKEGVSPLELQVNYPLLGIGIFTGQNSASVILEESLRRGGEGLDSRFDHTVL